MVQRGMVAVRSARTALFVALLVGLGLTSVGVASASASETPGSESVLLGAAEFGAAQIGAAQFVSAQSVAFPSAASPTVASPTAGQKPFPIGYVIGGILVVLGIGGGIYGQRMRIRDRKPPHT